MGWFGRKSAATVPTAPLVPAWIGRAESDGLPRSYQARFNEVYINNPVGQRAVRLVAGTTASLKIYAVEGKDRSLELINSPWLIETVAAHLLLHGNAFIQCVPGARGLGALFPLRPERVSVVTGEQGWPAAYLYRVGAGQPKRYAARDPLARTQIIHLRSLHPGDDHLGLGL